MNDLDKCESKCKNTRIIDTNVKAKWQNLCIQTYNAWTIETIVKGSVETNGVGYYEDW